MTLKQAIKAKCLDCCCGQIVEVRECAVAKCPLYPFRLGKNPYKSPRVLTEEARGAMSARLKAIRARKSEKLSGKPE